MIGDWSIQYPSQHLADAYARRSLASDPTEGDRPLVFRMAGMGVGNSFEVPYVFGAPETRAVEKEDALAREMTPSSLKVADSIPAREMLPVAQWESVYLKLYGAHSLGSSSNVMEISRSAQKSSSAIIVVGKSGLGKSTFCNIYSGSDNPTGAGVAGVSTKPIEGTRVSIIDMPGYGDVGGPNREPINDTVIHRWLLKYVMSRKVIGIIVFVSQDDVCQARLAPEVKSLLEVLGTRFAGFEALCFFAVSGKSMLGSMSEFLRDAASSILTGKLRIMGLGARNWARCKKKDFSAVTSWCDSQYALADPPTLAPRITRDTCRRCGKIGDPLLIVKPCRFHGESGGAVHSRKTTRFHPGEPSITHSGRWDGFLCVGKWTCCGKSDRESNCDHIHHTCCPNGDGQKCFEKCDDCGKTVKEVGCKGTCCNCNSLMSAVGCQRFEAHDWKGEMTKHVIQFETLDHVHAIDERKVEALFDDMQVDDNVSFVEAYYLMVRLAERSLSYFTKISKT
ncbi:hypothetical protein DFJ73DRAFT_785712 [Zopfochytrium polystomum]|nr:hypothetical protein DFJ73DRAFT_785712 [Zopfochytrium polystomum]